ncbi:MAG: hypothetical protein ABH877_03125, partial [bacterium]
MADERKALRGRFLRQRVCDSPTVAALVKKLGPWAGMLFDRLIVISDDDGRFLAEPGVVGAKCLPHHRRSERQIAAILDEMQAMGFVVLYADEMGSRYGAWRKWRKHQPKPRPDRYIPSELPPPPAGSTDVQSARRSARQSGDNLPSSLEPATEEEDEVEGEEEEDGARSRTSPPGCPFCLRPTRGPLQHYHDEAKRKLGRCLVIPAGKAGPAIARLERELGRDRCHALFAVYLDSQDPFVQKNGYSLMIFTSESIQNGLAEALDKGYTHGKPGSRRQA